MYTLKYCSGRKLKGFTMIEVLLALALFAMLAGMIGNLLKGSRLSVSYAKETESRLRRTILLRELIQSDLDKSVSMVELVAVGKSIRGFSFQTYGLYGDRNLLLRVRYMFEQMPGTFTEFEQDMPFGLTRYTVVEGVGVKETKEVLVRNAGIPRIRSYVESSGDFLDAEGSTESTAIMRIDFKSDGNADEFFILKNGYVSG